MNEMEESSLNGNRTGLPVSVLRLLVPPVRLVSAAIWKTIEQRVVAHYGMLEEFVSLVTDIVPDILTVDQRAQLTLGLRARLILELCQSTADLEIVQPHLDRMQLLIKVCATDVEAPHSEFVNLVKMILSNSDERQQFFQKDFPEQFGSTYDEALHILIWIFLSQLEKFLPLQTFQQVSSMFEVSSDVLQECLQSVSHQAEFKSLLHYQKDHSHLDHKEGRMEGACISSALKLPCVIRAENDKAHQHSNIQQASHKSHLDCENRPPMPTELFSPGLTTEDQANKKNVDKAKWITQDRKDVGVFGGRHSEFLQSKVEDGLEQCGVEVGEAVAQPSSSLHCQPVQPNRNQRLKNWLEEERSPSVTTHQSPCQKTCMDRPQVHDSCVPRVNENHEGDQAHPKKNISKSPQCTPEISVSNSKKQISIRLKGRSEKHRKSNASESKACTKKKAHIQCLICKEDVNISLKSHMKIHFPTGDYTCPRCDSRFKLYSSLKLHLNRTCFEYGRQHVDPEKVDKFKKLYKCDKCKEAFRYKVALERHNLTHSALYCLVCRKVLRDAPTLARHKASHTPFQCNRCEKSFTLFKPLLRHYQNIHKISRPFKCVHCSKTSTNLRILISHEWKHTGHLPFQCAHCGLRCKTDADLISHERVHTREKPYLCAECGKTFSRNSNLLRHLNFIHGESRDQKKYSCSVCEKSFKEKGALRKHQRSKHLMELFRHPCPYCGKMVSSSTMARHKLIHTGERPFKCTMAECDKDFRSNSEVKRHVLLHHSTERPYKCDICGKGFIKFCFLNAHAKIHSGEKPFICHICGKAFPKLYSMERHKKRIHPFIKD